MASTPQERESKMKHIGHDVLKPSKPYSSAKRKLRKVHRTMGIGIGRKGKLKIGLAFLRKAHIKVVPRTHPMFRGRAYTISGIDETGRIHEVSRISIPDTAIVCDSCNEPITTDKVNLLMLNEKNAWGAICEKCRKEYHSKLPIVMEQPWSYGIASATKTVRIYDEHGQIDLEYGKRGRFWYAIPSGVRVTARTVEEAKRDARANDFKVIEE